MADAKPASHRPWLWIPTLYLAEGLPYALAMSVSVVLYKNLGVGNKEIGIYTSWLYLPWVVKSLWSPVVEKFRTRRLWIWAAQTFMGAILAAVALAIPAPHFFQLTMAFFWLLAFSSATHDIAADGFYMLATTEHEQSFFNGIRSTFYRVATILAQGALVVFAGELQKRTGSFITAWSTAMALVAGTVFVLGVYHCTVLPKPDEDKASPAGTFLGNFLETFADFFRKPKIAALLAFLLLYRLGEAQLVKMAQPFLLDSRAAGGLGLDDTQTGLIYGTIGVGALMLGGILGGFAIARNGLKFWLWPMLLAIHLPDAVFIWLAYAQPGNSIAIGASVAVEQFGYGFGFTAFMLYMIYIVRGEHRTAHYAICSSFMALGMMLPGRWSGQLQEMLGYRHFFVWVILATIPSFIAALYIPLDAEFGKRNGK